MQDDRYWMKRALVLARRGIGQTQPNPMVGAIVLDAQGNKVGEGFHPKAGQAHAEIFALSAAKERAQGGTLYVTLEPCCHQGRTGPCTQAIIAAGIKRVVVACADLNPVVAGRGCAALKTAGIEVSLGIEEAWARALNAAFFYRIIQKKAQLVAKVAVTPAGVMGSQKRRLFISDSASLPSTMRLRAEAGAIVVGVNTCNLDDPQLTVRGRWSNRQPLRIVVDPQLRIDEGLRFIDQARTVPTLIYTTEAQHAAPKWQRLEKMGCLLYGAQPEPNGTLSFNALKTLLAHPEGARACGLAEPINRILLEGGASMLASAHQEAAVDAWVMYESLDAPADDGDEEGRIYFPIDRRELGEVKWMRRVGRDQHTCYIPYVGENAKICP